ncbi:hypothetical protein [Corynebacterium lactis]|uniref:Uncharacterized protein n=1 Tax=Corynebacterium lactis RW2-5 TaxID=1408189 RepID=A0A0K2H153_9CORY|nr:hypothetical protein [Corynebacterium lactis]ALA67760.1 hypothetical protein CLAC_08560 [Corynebacterium lactis RW2-5]
MVNHFDARLRLREVTQELYDIGDEVAEHIEHLAQAVADVDRELVDECVLELADIVDEAVEDSRPLIGELDGLRQAFTSGIRSGRMGTLTASAGGSSHPRHAPKTIDVQSLSLIPAPIEHPVALPTVTQAMIARSDAVAAYLEELADWVSAENIRGVEKLGCVALSQLYAQSGRQALAAAAAWCVAVPETHPAVAKALRGRRPPEFLMERARIDEIVRRVKRRRQLEHA